MKVFLILFILLFSSNVSAEEIAVEFAYGDKAKAFTLYMDKSKFCTVNVEGVISSPSTTNALSMDCSSDTMSVGAHTFTMTATNLEDFESSHSPEYVFTKEASNDGLSVPIPQGFRLLVTYDAEEETFKVTVKG